MNARNFQTAGELKDFVNDQSILQTKIQQIVFDLSNGQWWLFWWT
jgi:hypothetical protein